MAREKELEEYIQALEEELAASIEREDKLANEDLRIRPFLVKKIKRTRLYKNIISNPDSKAGSIARAPRSAYRLIKSPEARKNLMQKKTINDGHILDPWTVDLEKRREIAEKALRDGRKLALYFVEKPDSSTFRYRCYNTFEATKNSEKWQAVYFFKNEVDEVKKIVPKCGVLIFGRQSGQEKIVKVLVELAHENNKKVGLDIDDLVFDLKYIDVVLDTIGEKVNRGYWLAYFASVQAMAKQMDFFITTNDFLAGKLKESFGKPCAVVRNSLNTEQVNASSVYIEQKRKDDDFVIGYFSGSPTHAKDFAVAEPEVIKFLKKYTNATLWVVGYMKFSKVAEKLVNKGRIKFLPMADFRKLQRLMAKVDVNIAPLVVNDFTNCKSELKFFEAAAVETVTIASPTYAFKNSITDSKNGFLAESGEWYDKLEFLYNNPEERKAIAKKAREYALDNYYGGKFLKEVEGAYELFG